MNQKETKQVVETQESKEKMVVLKRSPKWWIGMAAVGGLLVGAGSGFGVGVIASQSSNNQQFSQPVQTKEPISNKIVKMAMLHKETSKMVAHRTAVLKVARKEVAKAKVARKVADLVRCHRKAMVAHKGMVQKMA